MTLSFPDVDYSACDCFESGQEDFERATNEGGKKIHESPAIFSNKAEEVGKEEESVVGVAKAFHIFGGNILDTRDLDYSDSISARQTSSRDETIVQRYQRLCAETSQLELDLSSSAFPASEKEKADLLPSVSKLSAHLKDLYHHKNLFASTARLEGGADFKSFSLVQSIGEKMEDGLADSNKKKTENDSTHFTYELYLKSLREGKRDAGSDAKTIASLEKRLGLLESVIGTESSAQLETQASLMETVEKLETIVRSMNPKYLESSYRKLKVAAAELTGPKSILSKDTETQIRKLHDTFGKFESVIDIVPVLIERLKSVKGLQREGTCLVNSVKEITEDQNHIKESLIRQRQAIEGLEKSIKENAEVMKGNVQYLEQLK